MATGAPDGDTRADGNRRLGVRGVRKVYGSKEVLRGVDLDVQAGEVCFLLGVNGAGKSTLLGCMGGTVAIDGGAIRIGASQVDLASQPDAALQPLVLLPQKPPLAPLLSPHEHLEAMIALRSLDLSARDRFGAAAAALGIAGFVDAPCRTLSGGTQQKVGLSLALAAAPEVLLLDEPWTGLDILSARALRRLLEAERSRGAALLVASHLPETAAQLADRCVVLTGGRIVATLDSSAMRDIAGDPARFEAAVVEAMAGTGVVDEGQ